LFLLLMLWTGRLLLNLLDTAKTDLVQLFCLHADACWLNQSETYFGKSLALIYVLEVEVFLLGADFSNFLDSDTAKRERPNSAFVRFR
jgi:hypothetical protein